MTERTRARETRRRVPDRPCPANNALTHDGHPELARHISHAVIKQDPREVRITKEFKKSLRRIDLAMASIMAFDRAKELAGKTVKFW